MITCTKILMASLGFVAMLTLLWNTLFELAMVDNLLCITDGVLKAYSPFWALLGSVIDRLMHSYFV